MAVPKAPSRVPGRLAAAERAGSGTLPNRAWKPCLGNPACQRGGCCTLAVGERRRLFGALYPDSETRWLQKTKSNNVPLFHPAVQPEAPAPAPHTPSFPEHESGDLEESRDSRASHRGSVNPTGPLAHRNLQISTLGPTPSVVSPSAAENNANDPADLSPASSKGA